MKDTKVSEFITVKTLDEAGKDLNGFLFNNLDFAGWTKERFDDLGILNFKKSKDGITAEITLGGTPIIDAIFTCPDASLDSDAFLKKFKEDIKAWSGWKEFGPKGVPGGKIEETKLDDVPEELLETAGPMKSMEPEEVLAQQGFVKGAIVKRCLDEWHCDYGIFTGSFYKSEGGTIGLNFTDGRSFHQDYCTLVDDVNKEILRMVEAEKGRIMEEALQFAAIIDNTVQEIIYG